MQIASIIERLWGKRQAVFSLNAVKWRYTLCIDCGDRIDDSLI
jgi:hypothetical protein